MDNIYLRIDGKNIELIDAEGHPISDVNNFLTMLYVRGLSPYTARSYAFDLLFLYRWMKRISKKLRSLTQSDLLLYVAAQQKKGANPRSINRRLTACRLLYRFTTGEELDDGFHSGMPDVKHFKSKRDYRLGILKLKNRGRQKLRVKVPHKLIDPLNHEEILCFLRSLRRYRDFAIVHLMLLCGLRSKELLQLKVKNISFTQRQIRIFGKGQKERVLPLPELAVRSLDDYLRYERPHHCKENFLFVALQGERRGHPLSVSGLRNLFRYRRMKLNLLKANPHRLRHTFGSMMAKSGVQMPVLQKMMGHADSQTTLLYINLSMEDISREYYRALEKIEKKYDPADV